MRDYLQRQDVERHQSWEVSQRIKAYKFEMKRISGRLDSTRISLKWGTDTVEKTSSEKPLFYSSSDDDIVSDKDDFVDSAIFRTLYRKN